MFLLALFFSCTNEDKENQRILDAACEQIMGTYKFEDAVLVNPMSLDIDGDGICNTDIMKEYMGLRICRNRLNKEVMRVRKASSFDTIEESQMSIPMQNITYYETANMYEGTDGETIFVPFAYSITKEGDIELKIADKLDIKKDFGGILRSYDFSFAKTQSIDMPAPGLITIRMECGFYDFASKAMVVCPVEFRYERISYSTGS